MMYYTSEKNQCTGCGACTIVCPKKCINFTKDNEGFLYPSEDNNCIKCGKCYNICPLINKKEQKLSNFNQFAVAARHKDYNVWERSTSGGAFTAICNAYCKDGDAIYGAKYDNLRVVHDYVNNAKEINIFRKSKYIQSDMTSSYSTIKAILKTDKKVLFSGTPCQVAGLKGFLGKDYENLLCVDLICHGVGSPGVFEDYTKHLEQKRNSKIQSFSFRNKRQKMGRTSEYIVNIEFENGVKLEEESNLYNKGFLQALFLRPSCGECKFTNLNRVGDITIADFKKRHELLPDLKGNQNLSSIIVNTEKGERVFQALKETMEIYPVKIEDLVRTNHPLSSPSVMSSSRDNFFNDINDGQDIELTIKKYIKKPGFSKNVWLILPDSVKRTIKRSMRWIKR